MCKHSEWPESLVTPFQKKIRLRVTQGLLLVCKGVGWPDILGGCKERRARSKLYTVSLWSLSVVVMHVAEAPGRSCWSDRCDTRQSRHSTTAPYAASVAR